MGASGRVWNSWRKRAAIVAGFLAAGMAAMTISLRIRGNPWRLDRSFPSGFNELDYAGTSGGPGCTAALSPDGRLVAIGKPDAQCEIHDLATGRRAAVLGQAAAPDRDRGALGGVSELAWFPDNARVAVCRGEGWRVLGMDGRETPVKDRDYIRDALPCRAVGRQWLATASLELVSVLDLQGGRTLHEWKLEHINGGHRRFDWTGDGRYLLLNDWLGLRVWDVPAGKLLFFHRELDMALPSPHVAGETSGIKAPRTTQPATLPEELSFLKGSSMEAQASRPPSNVAYLLDSCFSRDGRFVITLYSGDEGGFGRANPDTSRLRFWDTATGTLLWDEPLPMPPDSMELSPDGTRLHVLSTMDVRRGWRSVVRTYDVASRAFLDQAAFKVFHCFPGHIRALPDNRWLAAYSDQLWLVDTQGQCAAVRLEGSPNVADLFVTPNGRGIVEVGKDKTVRLWRQRREMTVSGAWELPETWGLYALSALGFSGLAVIAGRDKARAQARPLPGALWVVGAILALGLACRVAGDCAGLAVDSFYDAREDSLSVTTLVTRGVGYLLAVGCLLGVMRLRRGWRICEIVLLVVGLLVLAGVGAFVTWAAFKAPGFFGSVVVHGYLVELTIPRILAAIGGAILLAGLELVLLLRPSIRSAFPPRPRPVDGTLGAGE